LAKVVAQRAIKTLAKCSDAKVILRLFRQPHSDYKMWGRLQHIPSYCTLSYI